MATEDEERSAEAPTPPSDARGKSPVEDGSRKRKMSSAQRSDDGTAKRSKPESRDSKQSSDQGRRPSGATEEEKQRGKRLFGGLLNTLSQKTSNPQQRRRQEIERRQRDKMQQQAAEEDKKRAEKRAALHDIRMEQQITWEERVMRSRHAKTLKLAQFLQTRSTPEIYFLPRRLSRREKDIIEAQVRNCKASISRELEDFKGRKEQHLKRYGSRRDSDAAPSPAQHHKAAQHEPAEDAVKKTAAPVHDMHDDSGDVLVEAEEDTVIY
ncbi:pinin/SDK/memA/ protein [Hirsutella rhossiliensis]|uniref:Pinin/SDK/memA/ protein n=1 Tax=Hirsutella rhossiliensis TaxID=111463 RepID=A0A9P8MVI2_9HYPO|nr:pinin/SDK/memA/ protein [Hirsutella rhossiliensis]KAH0962963.1 pinin/SDK/memA/ protein [Hirsutella rhossiliensis]